MKWVDNGLDFNVIDDSNAAQYANDPSTSDLRSYVARDFSARPFAGYSPSFSRNLIPRSEWKERIEERTAKRQRLFDIFKHKKLPILNQKRLPYCWAYGTVGAMALMRAVNNLPTLHLSATSVASKIKNYREVGGWAEEAIEGIDRFGVSTVKYWPEAVNDRRYDTAEQRENAKLHKIIRSEELPSNNFDAIVTSLLLGFPVTLGLTWWGHLVFALDPVILSNGGFGLLFANSWGQGWEQEGLSVLNESKGTAYEAFSIQSVTLSLAV